MRTSDLKVGELYELSGFSGPCRFVTVDGQGNPSSPLVFEGPGGEERRARISRVLQLWERREEQDRQAVAAAAARGQSFETLREFFADFGVNAVRFKTGYILGGDEVRIQAASTLDRCVLELHWDTFEQVMAACERRAAKRAAGEEAARPLKQEA